MTAPTKEQALDLIVELESIRTANAPDGYLLQSGLAKLRSFIESSDAELPVGEPEVCKWMEDDPWGVMPGTYASQCGEMWSFIDGGPTENHVRYCHGCGKPVRVVPFPVEPEEEEVGSGERGE
jgi:hypothetical protein